MKGRLEKRDERKQRREEGKRIKGVKREVGGGWIGGGYEEEGNGKYEQLG